MLKTVRQTIKKHQMITAGDYVIIGLSGGADSVGLLYALLALQAKIGILQVFAVHVNHGLRPGAAQHDQDFVAALCGGLQIPLKIYRADIRSLAQKEALSIEAAGRKMRYFYLNKACAAFGVPGAKIATGHHQNDNAETVLMNLARGAGLRGLCGIPPVNGNIIRPLLDVPRRAIEAYLEAAGATYVTDASNHSHEYTRNRIRHMVVPALEAAVNPRAVQVIANNAGWLQADEAYLEGVAAKAFETCAVAVQVTAVSLNAAALAALDPAIGRRVVRRAIGCLDRACHLPNIAAVHIQSVLDLAHMQSGKETHLPGFVAHRAYDGITISPRPAGEANGADTFGAYALSVPMAVNIPEINRLLTLSHTPPNKLAPPNGKKSILDCTKVFEYGIVEEALFLRTRRPGDRILLSGSKPFTKKLQDYFTDAKVPKHQRDAIPVLACGSDILWVLDKKGPTSEKYSPSQKKLKNPVWVSLWRDADE